MMKYKGYTGVVEIDEESGLLFGQVIGLRDGINFQGETVAETRRSFEESVDGYLAFCASREEAPEKPFSGKFMLRISPELHRALVAEAQARKSSLNALIEGTLASAFPATSLDAVADEPPLARASAGATGPKKQAEAKPRRTAETADRKAGKAADKSSKRPLRAG